MAEKSWFNKYIFDSEENTSSAETPAKVESLQKGKSAQAVASTPDVTQNTQQAATPAAVTIPITPGAPIVGQVTEEVKEYFEKLLNPKNFPGIGYGAFNDALDALASLKGAIPEPQRYETALKTLQAQKIEINKSIILESLNGYITALKTGLDKAEALVDQRKSEEITTRQQKIELNDASILEKQKQIEKLNTEITTLKADNNTQLAEIQQQSTIIEQRHQNFIATWNVFNSGLAADIQAITSYLPDAPAQA